MVNVGERLNVDEDVDLWKAKKCFSASNHTLLVNQRAPNYQKNEKRKRKTCMLIRPQHFTFFVA